MGDMRQEANEMMGVEKSQAANIAQQARQASGAGLGGEMENMIRTEYRMSGMRKNNNEQNTRGQQDQAEADTTKQKNDDMDFGG